MPLDKLQDLKLSQDFCGRYFDLWSMSAETAGQSGDSGGPELSLIGLKDHRGFKQRVLQQRNELTSTNTAPGTVSADSAVGKVEGSAELVPILERIEQHLANLKCVEK